MHTNLYKQLFLTSGLLLMPLGTVLAAEGPRAVDVLARHFAALGGISRLEKIQTMIVKAEGEERNDAFDFELKLKRPGMILAEATNARLRVLQGRDRRAQCWRMGPDGLQDMTGDRAGELMDLALVFFGSSQLFWNEALAEAVCQEEREEDREVVVIGRQDTPSFFPRLVFDKATGRLAKVGQVTAEDYREVQGIQVPFLARQGDQVKIRIKEVTFNVPLEDSVFDKPQGKAAKAMTTPTPGPEYATLQSTPGHLEIVRRPPVANFLRGRLDVLPHYDPASSRQWQVDLRGYDLSRLDLNGRLNDLLHANFDSQTRWPVTLPAGFDRGRIFELGKDPGLGIRELHRRGITGKGIRLGIIDQTLLVDHVEYRDRLRFYEEIHSPKNAPAQMHGPAVASIAVGKTVGVAPDATLFYVAEMHGVARAQGDFAWDFTWLAQAIHRLLDVNTQLPATNKIRVISISVGWSPSQQGFTNAEAAVNRAKKEGVFVVSTSIEQSYHVAFHGLGREAMSDPNQANSYGPGSWWAGMYWGGQQQFAPGRRLLVPMDSRCTASPTGPEDYVFYSSGGWSWAVPWISGLYALACQVKPDLTPELFWAEALKTGHTIRIKHENEEQDFGTIANPVALIERLQSIP